MSRASASELYDGIAACKKPHHDTLYCTERQYNKLVREASSGTMSSFGGRVSDGIRIAGLDVITFDRIERPIVCQKGEVFPLTEDWRDE